MEEGPAHSNAQSMSPPTAGRTPASAVTTMAQHQFLCELSREGRSAVRAETLPAPVGPTCVDVSSALHAFPPHVADFTGSFQPIAMARAAGCLSTAPTKLSPLLF